ncbi:UNVERIFIED_CONTAM: hypothetical protein Sradi_0493300 [Sesamum radiatum]|uniref:DUF4218 domain-containing protein n=1 Tax=Sesamum radiatum TaxID=300843 RepID=A0AAW2W814_SESRA
MEHLLVHLPYEARVGGPVQYRRMYPFERFLYFEENGKEQSSCRGFNCEAYIVEEISTFTTQYFEPDVIFKKRRPRRNDDGLNNENIEHMAFLQDLYERYDVDTVDIDGIVAMQFLPWFKTYIADPSNRVTNLILKMLAWGPSQQVLTWPAYFINGYNFHTLTHGEEKSTMNSGICVRSSSYSDSDSDFFWMVGRAFQEDEVESIPIVTIENEVQPLHDINGIANYQEFAANDIDEEEDSFENYETKDDDDDEALGQDEDDDDY